MKLMTSVLFILFTLNCFAVEVETPCLAMNQGVNKTVKNVTSKNVNKTKNTTRL